MTRAGYRHRDGLFPPIRTAFDHCPYPHYVRYIEGRLVRVGVDGVDWVSYGGAEQTQLDADRMVREGHWLMFDPDLKSNWRLVLTGLAGEPAVKTTDGDYPVPASFRETWPAAAEAREDELNEIEDQVAARRARRAVNTLPAFFITRLGLFGDGEHGPYWASVVNGEFFCHGLDGDTHSLGKEDGSDWEKYTLFHLKTGEFVPFDPIDPDAWKKVIYGLPGELKLMTANGHVEVPTDARYPRAMYDARVSQLSGHVQQEIAA